MSNRVSASREFIELASAIDPGIPSGYAAELLVAFRDAVRADLLREIADQYEQRGRVVLTGSQVAAELRSGEVGAGEVGAGEVGAGEGGDPVPASATVSLGAPCVRAGGGHSRNWHNGPCSAKGSKCDCLRFIAPAGSSEGGSCRS